MTTCSGSSTSSATTTSRRFRGASKNKGGTDISVPPFLSSRVRTLVDRLRSLRNERCGAAAAWKLDVQRLDLVVHHARADRQQLRRVLLHPVRHLQRFDQRVPFDVLERNPRRRNLDNRRMVARPAR